MSAYRPRVSIGMPVHNGETFIEQALASVINQTFTDFELIISDNASTDRTREICEQWAARDPRICYYRSEQNMGAAWNFNRVFQLARGEYFHWQAHDDLILPTFLEKTVAILDQRPELVLVSSNVEMIDDNNVQIKVYDVHLKTGSPHARVRLSSLILDFHLCYEIFGLIRASAIRQTPLIGNYGHGDGIFLERLSLLGPFYEIPEILFKGRVHDRQSMRIYGALSKKKENDYHQYTLWFDPNQAGKILFPNWRILAERLKTVWSAPLTRFDQAYVLFFVLYWVGRRRKPLLKDVLIAASQAWSRSNEARPVNASPQGTHQ